MREFPPDKHISDAEDTVGRWREEANAKAFVKEQKKEFRNGYGA
jgi:hypothetical protein